jgi:hypothetical protein
MGCKPDTVLTLRPHIYDACTYAAPCWPIPHAACRTPRAARLMLDNTPRRMPHAAGRTRDAGLAAMPHAADRRLQP